MIKRNDMTMKTAYIHPKTVIITLHTKLLQTQSFVGAKSGSSLGNGFNGSDVSYSREQRSGWTDDDD